MKAVDPFAKKKKAEIDTIHDEPPSFYQSRGWWPDSYQKTFNSLLYITHDGYVV